MSLKERLETDAKTALKSKDRVRLGLIRVVRAQVKNAEIAKKHELSEEETIEVVVSVVKARRESLDYAVKGNRSDLVLQAEQELQILADYLPQQLSEEEVQDIVQRAIRETGAESPKDMGRVMGIIMPQVKGRADGKLVNNLVRQYLG
ncbi:MAG: GatB/YqeY domain-containing protein [Gemmatimonadota bacterium]|jgi:uncharacterized protein YqeY|nr:GatB/YqeY domain-containing protein [Gemmatimonadota bacterium]|tara:strand:+ start:424 stop:867 length:444 start_codon:yes stop_codon:yes gene_type:complete